MLHFYEFFAGGGMARAGLGPRWRCLFANDFDFKKSQTYRRNWGSHELLTADVGTLTVADLPRTADLVWGSFPCQDLSLAGGGAGLRGERSGTFWPFWQLMKGLAEDGRKPNVVVLENVCGTLTSHDGKDFVAICRALRDGGYRFGSVVVDAALFVPQSRPRLFVIAVRDDLPIPGHLLREGPTSPFHPPTLRLAHERLPDATKRHWLWWAVPVPRQRNLNLSEIIEESPASVEWHSQAETKTLLGMMSDVNLAKVTAASRAGHRMVGCVYRRTRRDTEGFKVQRAEVRFDNVAGCLRTPAGGSSRQLIVVVEGRRIRSRLLSSRETARLMGLPDTYQLPENYNEAYHVTGDGVVVPVVRHLAEHLIEPLVLSASAGAPRRRR
jgi:DNA (cytosine-5)-methyltransferase 1